MSPRQLLSPPNPIRDLSGDLVNRFCESLHVAAGNSGDGNTAVLGGVHGVLQVRGRFVSYVVVDWSVSSFVMGNKISKKKRWNGRVGEVSRNIAYLLG